MSEETNFGLPKVSPVIQAGQILNAVINAIGATAIVGAVWYVSGETTKTKTDLAYAQDAIKEIKQQNAATLQTLNTLSASLSEIKGALNATRIKTGE